MIILFYVVKVEEHVLLSQKKIDLSTPRRSTLGDSMGLLLQIIRAASGKLTARPSMCSL
jgi:hypothetical protein